jgi:hypothetical protein
MGHSQLRDVLESIYRALEPIDDHVEQRFVLWMPCHSSHIDTTTKCSD